jgi:hypothetical protein
MTTGLLYNDGNPSLSYPVLALVAVIATRGRREEVVAQAVRETNRLYAVPEADSAMRRRA